MAMSGDLDAPLTDLSRSGGLPDRVTPRLDVGPATRKLGCGLLVRMNRVLRPAV